MSTTTPVWTEAESAAFRQSISEIEREVAVADLAGLRRMAYRAMRKKATPRDHIQGMDAVHELVRRAGG